VAHLTRLLGPAQIDLAEEAVQEAMLRALQSWPYSGVPENAPAWLFRVAHNAAIDAVRRNRLMGEKADALEGYTAHEGEDLIRRDLCLEAVSSGAPARPHR
jgi:predicted RNA polymerase sigma factor